VEKSLLSAPLLTLVVGIGLLGMLLGIAISTDRALTSRSSQEIGRRFQQAIDQTESLELSISALRRIERANSRRITALERRLDSPVEDGESNQGATRRGVGKRTAGKGTAGKRAGDRKNDRGPSQGSGEGLIAEFTGTGPQTTAVFAANGPWRIQWEGPDVFFFIKKASGFLVHGDGGAGTGTYRVAASGRFYLDILARGKWTIKVLRT
jgi:hypothetical protein